MTELVLPYTTLLTNIVSLASEQLIPAGLYQVMGVLSISPSIMDRCKALLSSIKEDASLTKADMAVLKSGPDLQRD